jgi:WhiB family redox-sensing transcriptional regulator
VSDWKDEALCAYVDPDLWYPEKGASSFPAKRICGQCPVRPDCLDDALERQDTHGIWGGLSYRQRLQLDRAGSAQAAA